MANDSKTLFQSFVRRGLSDRDALFALMDYWAESNHSSRERQQQRITVLEVEIAELKRAIADMTTKLVTLEAHSD